MPLSPGYDVLGPIARSVRDASLILSVILGPDPANDPLTLSAPDPFPAMPLTARKGRRPLAGHHHRHPADRLDAHQSQGIQIGTSPQDTVRRRPPGRVQPAEAAAHLAGRAR